MYLIIYLFVMLFIWNSYHVYDAQISVQVLLSQG